jgi:signal transduction histidine kinase
MVSLPREGAVLASLIDGDASGSSRSATNTVDRGSAPILLVQAKSAAAGRAILRQIASDCSVLDGAHSTSSRVDLLAQAQALASHSPVIVLVNAAEASSNLNVPFAPNEALSVALDPGGRRPEQREIAWRDLAMKIMSHELRGLLGTVDICAAALLDPVPPPPSGVRDMAWLIRRATTSMQTILQDLRDIRSLQEENVKLELRAASVSELVSTAQLMFVQLAEEQEIEFVAESDVELFVDVDERRLLQVLANLLGNAMRFTPPGGRVVLAARTEAKPHGDGSPGVRFDVSDTGPGMPTENLQPFNWAIGPGSDAGQWAGLGLAIARSLVRAHGSQLQVERSEGHGSRFWFTLPVSLR